MSDKHHDNQDRRALLGGLGAAALAGIALSGKAARAQTASGRFEAQRHALDAWMDALPGTHRVFIDTDITAGGVNALRYAMNLMNSHVSAYQGSEADMAIVICYRHASTPLGYNDALWAKYGKTFATLGRLALKEGEAAPSANPQMATLAAHAGKGMHFAVCNSASTMIAGVIARETSQKLEDVLAELTANLIPNGHMVPAGVMAVTRAQEYGYSFLYSSAT